MKQRINFEVKKMLNIKFSGIIVLMFLAISAWAQPVIKDQVNVLGSYIPELKPKEKFYDRPTVNDTFRTSLKPDYHIEGTQFNYNYSPDTLSPARMKSEPLKKLKRFYLKVGFGNYMTPLAEFRINSLRSKTNAYNFGYKFFSSGGKISGKGFPGIMDHEATGDFRHFFKRYIVKVNGAYTYNRTHYYGYNALDSLNQNITPLSIRQAFNKIAIGASFGNHNLNDSSKLITQFSLNYYYLFDRYASQEHGLSIKADISKYVKEFYVGGRLGVDIYNNTNLNLKGQPNTLLHFNPYLRAGRQKWDLEAGVIVSGAFGNASKGFIFPNVRGSFNLYQKYLILFADVVGGLERSSYDKMRKINPFIVPNSEMRNTYTSFDAGGGLRGSFSRDVTYKVGASYKLVNNMALFVTDTSRQTGNYFKPVYDDIGILRINAEAAYRRGENLSIGLKGNYYLYSPKNNLKAWHNPNLDVTLTGMYNISDKFIVKLDVFYIGNQWAPTYQSGALVPVKLKGLADINAGFEYRYNKMLSAFISVNNIAAFRYNRWFNYPTQQFNLLGGVTLNF